MTWKIILCSGAEHLEEDLRKLGYDVYKSGLNYDGKRFFPNSDLYTRIDGIDELSGKDVLVIQSGTFSGELDREKFTTADRVWEVLQVLDVLRCPLKVEEKGHKVYEYEELEPPRRIEVLYTFLPCALQDKAFKTGEAVSAKLAVELTLAKADRVITIDPHPPEDVWWVRRLREENKLVILSAVPMLIDEASNRFGIKEYELIAPDEGAQRRLGIRGFTKQRIDSFTVVMRGELNVAGKNVIVIDDLTKSGSTLIKARENLMKMGAQDVICCVTHVLPTVEKGEELLRKLVERINGRILTTNTVRTRTFEEEHPECLVSIAPLIDKYLKSAR
ncbi:MAG: phosphoribosyltransferase family protein [Candidatus Baldrarchaeia archaeon]